MISSKGKIHFYSNQTDEWMRTYFPVGPEPQDTMPLMESAQISRTQGTSYPSTSCSRLQQDPCLYLWPTVLSSQDVYVVKWELKFLVFFFFEKHQIEPHGPKGP